MRPAVGTPASPAHRVGHWTQQPPQNAGFFAGSRRGIEPIRVAGMCRHVVQYQEAASRSADSAPPPEHRRHHPLKGGELMTPIPSNPTATPTQIATQPVCEI